MIAFRVTVFALLTIHIDFYILESTLNLAAKIIRPQIFIMILIYRVREQLVRPMKIILLSSLVEQFPPRCEEQNPKPAS